MVGRAPQGMVWAKTVLKKVTEQKGVRISPNRFRKWVNKKRIPNIQLIRAGKVTAGALPKEKVDETVSFVDALIKKEGTPPKGFLDLKHSVERVKAKGIQVSPRDLISFAQDLRLRGIHLESQGVIERNTSSSPFNFSEKGIDNAIKWIKQVEQRIERKELVPLNEAAPRSTKVYYAELKRKGLPKVFFRGNVLVSAKDAVRIKRKTSAGMKAQRKSQRLLTLTQVSRIAAERGISVNPQVLNQYISDKKLSQGVVVRKRPTKEYLIRESQLDALLQRPPTRALPPKDYLTLGKVLQRLEEKGIRVSKQGLKYWMEKTLQGKNAVAELDGLLQDRLDSRRRYLFSPQAVRRIEIWASSIPLGKILSGLNVLIPVQEIAKRIGTSSSYFYNRIQDKAVIIGKSAFLSSMQARAVESYLQSDRKQPLRFFSNRQQNRVTAQRFVSSMRFLSKEKQAEILEKISGFFNQPFEMFVTRTLTEAALQVAEENGLTIPQLESRINTKTGLNAIITAKTGSNPRIVIKPITIEEFNRLNPRFKLGIVQVRLRRMLAQHFEVVSVNALAAHTTLSEGTILELIIAGRLRQNKHKGITIESVKRLFSIK